MIKLLITILQIFIVVLNIHSLLKAQGELFGSDIQLGKIMKLDLNSSLSSTVILSQSFVDYHVIDFESSCIYWTDKGKLSLVKSNIDGSNQTTLISNLSSPKGITIDGDGLIYFIDGGKIMQSDPLGVNQKVIAEDLAYPRDLDYMENKLYWSDNINHVIEVIDIDGTNRKTLINDAFNVIDLQVDKFNNELYWVQRTGGIPGSGIFKSQLDGTNRETVLEEFANGIFIDGEALELYWSESIFNTINRLDLTDINVNTRLISDYLPSPKTISIDKLNNKIYYTDNRNGGFLYNAILSNGGSVTKLAETLVYRPDRLEIDSIHNKVYWINANSGSGSENRTNIMRSDLDGGNIEILISNPEILSPKGLAIDIVNNHIYWSDLYTISRSNLDGGEIIDLVTDLIYPRGLSIDFKNKKLFWADWGSKKIQRSDLNGMNVEDIIDEGLEIPIEIAIYHKASKLYWTDIGNGMINRSDLNGLNIENVITTDNPSFNRPNSIIIDERNDKLYYSISFSGESILRSDADGNNIEEIVTEDLASPADLFLTNALITSLGEVNSKKTVVAYPNPVSDKLLLRTDKNILKIAIYNCVGSLVYMNYNINTNMNYINTAELPNGIYSCIIYMDKYVEIIKLMKMK